AVVYRAKNGIDPRSVRLAVVVQRMVAAEVAGVLFTANPVSCRRRQAVIDARPGLGRPGGSGSVYPDRFVLATPTAPTLARPVGASRDGAATGERRGAPGRPGEGGTSTRGTARAPPA